MSKFERVQHYYQAGLWTEKMVKDAVGRWITQEEADIILGVNEKENEEENEE